MFRFALSLGLLVVAAPAWADCDSFKWSVARERQAFAAPRTIAAISDGASVGVGYAVTLSKDLSLPHKPEREPKPGTMAAVLDFGKLAQGTYQVTVSGEAWIDVFQDGKAVTSSAFSGQHDCAAVRKSVRFPLAAGPATIEISNAQGPTLNLAVEPAN